MTVEQLAIKDILLIKPPAFKDDRGYFLETYHIQKFKDLGIQGTFVQDNQSCSKAGTLRGLHFQSPPFGQGKLVRVARGRGLDVVVDLRRNSPTYGHHVKAILSEENHHQLWVPIGFAHGFLALQDDTLLMYKCTGLYHKASEGGIVWNDPDLNIDWQAPAHLTINEKDQVLPTLKSLVSPF